MSQALRRQNNGADDDNWDDVIMVVIGVVVAVAVVLWGLNWLDGHFGWHLHEAAAKALQALFGKGGGK